MADTCVMLKMKLLGEGLGDEGEVLVVELKITKTFEFGLCIWPSGNITFRQAVLVCVCV